jgi:hypothetical protein
MHFPFPPLLACLLLCLSPERRTHSWDLVRVSGEWTLGRSNGGPLGGASFACNPHFDLRVRYATEFTLLLRSPQNKHIPLALYLFEVDEHFDGDALKLRPEQLFAQTWMVVEQVWLQVSVHRPTRFVAVVASQRATTNATFVLDLFTDCALALLPLSAVPPAAAPSAAMAAGFAAAASHSVETAAGARVAVVTGTPTVRPISASPRIVGVPGTAAPAVSMASPLDSARSAALQLTQVCVAQCL